MGDFQMTKQVASCDYTDNGVIPKKSLQNKRAQASTTKKWKTKKCWIWRWHCFSLPFKTRPFELPNLRWFDFNPRNMDKSNHRSCGNCLGQPVRLRQHQRRLSWKFLAYLGILYVHLYSLLSTHRYVHMHHAKNLCEGLKKSDLEEEFPFKDWNLGLF